MKVKNKKFKILSIVAAIAVAATMLSACGGEKKSEIPTVTWYMSQSESAARDQEMVEKAANEILEKNIGLHLKFYFLDSDNFEQKMQVMSNAGEEYDIVSTNYYMNKYIPNISRGAFLNVKDMLKEYAPDILAKQDQTAWDAVTMTDGGIYVIPGQNPWTFDTTYAFRKDLVEKYGFDVSKVKNIHDLEPMLEIIKKNEPDVIPVFATADGVIKGRGPEAQYDEIDGIQNVLFDTQTKKVVSSYDLEHTTDYYKTLNDFYKKGYIAKDAASRNQGGNEKKSGKYFVVSGPNEYTGGSKSTSQFGYECVEALLGTSKVKTTGITQSMVAISSSSKQPENALKVLNEIWRNPELSNLLAYGIKDVHYKVTANEGTDHPSVLPATGDDQRWCIYHNSLGPLWDQWDSPWNTSEALLEMQRKNKESERSELLGFTFEQEPIKVQLAEIASIQKEAKQVLETGSMDDFNAYYDNFKKRLDAAGLQDVIKEIQKQYDDWAAKKKN